MKTRTIIAIHLAVFGGSIAALQNDADALTYNAWANPLVYSGGSQSCLGESSGVIIDSGGCGSSTSYVYFDLMGLSIPDNTTLFNADVTVFTEGAQYEPKCNVKWCTIDGTSCSSYGYLGGTYESSSTNSTLVFTNVSIASGDYAYISCGFYGGGAIDQITFD